MQDRPNEYALEYKLGSEDERQFLVFTTTDFRLVLSTAERFRSIQSHYFPIKKAYTV